MEAMREAWTDERLDDLANRMDRGFDRVDARFDRIDARFDRIDDRFERIGDRFDWLWRLMLVTYVTTLVGLITAQL